MYFLQVLIDVFSRLSVDLGRLSHRIFQIADFNPRHLGQLLGASQHSSCIVLAAVHLLFLVLCVCYNMPVEWRCGIAVRRTTNGCL